MLPVTLEVLTSPACAHCHEFLEFWNAVAGDWPNVTMKEVSLLTEGGQHRAGEYQIFASPGIILNNTLFDSGGFDKKKFLAKLTELSK